jgi:hypothetical protein
MPTPFAAFLPLIGQGINAVSQLLTNKSQKNAALEMYNMQRADALADWNRQNQYNSPSAQMQRYKDAGLSPHLIYGQTNQAPAIRSSQPDVPKYQAPQIQTDTLNVPAIALQLEAQTQSLKNLKAQEELIKSQTDKTASETDWRKLNKEFLEMTQYTRAQLLQNQMLSAGSKNQLTQEQITTQQNKNKLFPLEQRKMNAEISNILARTNLSNEQKGQVAQLTQNAQVMYQILQSEDSIKKYEAEFIQKLKALGMAAQMAYMIAKIIK